MNKIILIIFGVLLISCQKEIKNDVPVHQNQELFITKIDFDSLILEKEYFSGIGFFKVGRDQLFFVDQVFSTVIAYSRDGSYVQTHLGKGDGPDEQNNIHGFFPFALEDKHVILDNFELVFFKGSFEKDSSYPIEWDYSESYQNMLNKPKGTMLGLYEIDWKSRGNSTDILIMEGENRALLPITMSHPSLNGYISEEYYKEVSVFGCYDFKNKVVNKSFGRRSEEYLSHRFIPNFDFSHFTKRNNELLVSFAIDPLIHVYGFDGVLKYKFGIKGMDIKTTYPKTNTIDDALDNYKLDLKKAGFYQAIYSDESKELTFRTYYPTGSEAGNARLQIYEKNVLIGDVLVPARFQVIGKIGDTYYADGIIDELNDRLGIYTFKLDSK